MKQWLTDVFVGSLAGVISTFVGHPLDTIKCRLQVNPTLYPNFSVCLIKMIKEEKVFGLFKGVVPPCLNQIVINAITFSEYYRMFRYLEKKYPQTTKGERYMLSGSYTGLIYVIINTPFELIKLRQQIHKNNYLPMSSICEDIMRNNGLKGFFRGFWATFNRDFFTTGLWFYIFFQLRDYYEEHNKATFYNLMFAGGVSGVVSWLVTYPFDILKSIIQIDKRNPTLTQREAYILLKNQPDYSTKRLFKGLGPTLTRAFYSNAVLFYVNEIGQNYFNGKGK